MATVLPSGRKHLVLYDGECEFCRKSAGWIKHHDPSGLFSLVPFQDAPSPPMTPALFESCKRTVHVITDKGKVIRSGRAWIFIIGRLGWKWTAAILSVPPFVWLVEAGYFVVSKNRAFFSKLLLRGYSSDGP